MQINSVEEIFLIVATNCLANLYIHMVGLLPFRPFLFSKFEPFFVFITLCRALKTLLKSIAQRPRYLSRKSQSSGVRFVNGSVSTRMSNGAVGEMLSRELALKPPGQRSDNHSPIGAAPRRQIMVMDGV